MKGMNMLPSKRLIASYIFDWVAIIIIAAIGAAFNASGPYHRPFSLVDLRISFPYHAEKIPTWLLVVLSLVAPAAIVFLVALILVPGPLYSRTAPKSFIWRRKLWEWNTGWLGLALSYAVSFLFTQGLKNLMGQPRPNMLSRCQPNIGNLAAHTVSNFAANFDPEWVLVDVGICSNPDKALIDEGFRSFPSGHASASWAGLMYLAFFLCAKFAIGIPFLQGRSVEDHGVEARERQGGTVLPLHHDHHGNGGFAQDSLDSTATTSTYNHGSASTAIPTTHPLYNQAAAPPVYLLTLPLIPIGVAIYITASRYFDFYHHAFDLIVGSLIGIISAWFGFRWYHLPLRQGAGWAWGARSRDRAFWVGIGRGGYVGKEGWGPAKEMRRKRGDIEEAKIGRVNGGGDSLVVNGAQASV